MLDLNTIYVLIRRDSDLTPILEKLDNFFIYDECNINEWSITQYLNGKRISLIPECLKSFDWDLYHNGCREKEREFESIYSKMKNELLDKLDMP
ncbi:Uncharacterised protein [Canicola haemoglobinophilus]|uniref:Uncharacterized protein n=1 Tax=Canicola haemoglobinophilus TaxID=733 RepID=A0AB38HAF9_9PAST|nr:stage III sporulation protein AF [Canicola haemoglobinophilus]STO55095.1 Uncharacterised protein [Canicola haemoglobinophilus]STO69334.1 Uncharacterised protein [Canicola haemoglobinophilus]